MQREWCVFLALLTGLILQVSCQISFFYGNRAQVNPLSTSQFITPGFDPSEKVIEEDDYDYEDVDGTSPDVEKENENDIWFNDFGTADNIRDGFVTKHDLEESPSPNWNGTDVNAITTSSDGRYKCPKCTCGVRFRSRIVHGVIARKNEFPWMAMLEVNEEFFCGASVIADKFVLTAQHCTDGVPISEMSIRLREFHRYQAHETFVFRMKVKQKIERVDFNPLTYNNDLTLLRLKRRLTFQGGISPICLPDDGQSYEGKNGIVAGWGAIYFGGPTSGPLRKVIVPIIPRSKCIKTDYGTSITTKMLCAGYIGQGYKDSCSGDSGGPLMVISTHKFRLAGVVSYGDGCAKKNAPGVYARVNQFLKWIRKNTKGACFCK